MLLVALQVNALPPPCSCRDQSLCAPLARHNAAPEVFPLLDGFEFANGSKGEPWQRVNMSVATTIGYFYGHPWKILGNGTIEDVPSEGNYSAPGAWPVYDLLCTAHQNDVKVVVGVGTHAGTAINQMLPDPSARRRAVTGLAALVRATSADGVQLDFEELDQASNASIGDAYVQFVGELGLALRADNPYAQLTVATACIVNRIIHALYKFEQLAAASDGLFLMCCARAARRRPTTLSARPPAADDMNKHRRPGAPGRETFAAANAPLPALRSQVDAILALPVHPAKLIMAIPWYGVQTQIEPRPEGLARC
jgi:spore germination protein YaaH